MAPIFTAFVVGYSFLLAVLTIFRVKILKLLIVSLIISQTFCLYDIFTRNPGQVIWLCNVTVFMQILLYFKFNQKAFDCTFFFAWTGCLLICFMPSNPYSIQIMNKPVIWMAYWIKHIIPLILPVYYFHVKKKKLSRWAIYTAAMWFLIYCGFVYIYNWIFDQNVFYLNKPDPIMGNLGRGFFFIACSLGYIWFSTLYVTANLLGWVKTKKESGSKEREKA